MCSNQTYQTSWGCCTQLPNKQSTPRWYIHDKAKVFDDANVHGRSEVYGSARIYDTAEIHGDAKIFGRAKVYGEIKISIDQWGDGEYFVIYDSKGRLVDKSE